MLFLYNIIVLFASQAIKILALFSPKMKLFVQGRKNVFSILEEKINSNDKTIWFHAASLGEYEQGLPVIEAIKIKYPLHKIVLTFFSPSGYEVRKNNSMADITLYMPLDTKSNAKNFLNAVKPEMIFFIKYEFWPNYLNEIKQQQIKTYLISGIFRENQVFFKWYGSFYRKALQTFTFFFVQNSNSEDLLKTLGFSNVKISGDTRFDRVTTILQQDNALDYIEEFKKDTITMVVGSSWPDDEELIIKYINETNQKVKFIIAPHNIKDNQIAALKLKIEKKVVLFSEKKDKKLVDYDVFIIDTIGLLTKIYSYADFAYVGGGFGNPGVHNILEPAAFGIPVIIGPNFSHFAEATELVAIGGCISISNQEELNLQITNMIENESSRIEKKIICEKYVQAKKGATEIILNTIL
jgi:3-deoxy-D-manno-octulosonic-acid transferase